MDKKRCSFCVDTKQNHVPGKFIPYHDTRWCKPEHRDKEQYAMLVLEGMQAGVSWNLILDKEENFRKAFDGFDPEIVASYDEAKVEELMQDKGIIRNRNKIRAAITNAQAFLKVQKEFGSFDKYIWGFTDGRVIDHHLMDEKDMPAKDELSERVSRDLKKRGFKFAGPTIIYSYLQGIGIINDHMEYCEYRQDGQGKDNGNEDRCG
ncbi:MAG: DNA-3-methyladenine glycosylase I [Lachnospiraceae bacterium]|nr:DNA-3-methyladenine glycosylase I [Lachnospiraceae bacterium]